MPTSKTLLPPPYQTLLDIDGDAIANGTVTFLETGTAILAVVYADADGAVISANPLTVDAAGRFTVWLTPGQVVDVEYRDPFGVLIKTVPGVMAMPGASGNVDLFGVLAQSVSPGDVLYLNSGVAGGTAGLWYHASGTASYGSSLPVIGLALAAGVIGASVPIRTAGLVTGLSSLIVGATYYVANPGGALSLTPGTFMRVVGQADTTTSLVVATNPAPSPLPLVTDAPGLPGVILQLVPTGAVMRLDNTALVTIHGIKEGYEGQRLRLIGANTGQVNLVGLSASAAPRDRLLNFATSAPTSLGPNAFNGTADYVYDAQQGFWRMVAHEQGSWITPAFIAADYTGFGAMTWAVAAGDVVRCAYYLQGRTLRVQLRVTGTVGGTPDVVLLRKIPGGFTGAAGVPSGPYAGLMGAPLTGAAWVADPTKGFVFYTSIASAPWALGTVILWADMTMEVN